MARSTLFAIALALTASGGQSAMSQSQQSHPFFVKVLRPLIMETNTVAQTPKSRASLASEIFGFCAGALSKIPRLSPREAAWLDSELSSARAVPAVASVEFSQRTAVDLLEGCATHSANIRTGNLPQKDEAIEWLGLASVFLDRDMEFHIKNVSSQKRINVDEFAGLDAIAFTMTGRWIVSAIAIPILKAK